MRSSQKKKSSNIIEKLKQILKVIFEDKGNQPMGYYESVERELSEKYIFDLKGSYFGNLMRGGAVTPNVEVEAEMEATELPQLDNTDEITIKRIVKPIEVLSEVSLPPRLLALENLDEKITMLEDKLEFLSNNYSKKQVIGLIDCLKNRKKYNAAFFGNFNTTNLDKVGELCKNHNLVIKSADLFIPEFPKEAMDIMKKYNEEVKSITGKQGVYYVIATKEDFKDVDNKRDPILLAQSPFGFYYDILGAWDKEMLVLSEL